MILKSFLSHVEWQNGFLEKLIRRMIERARAKIFAHFAILSFLFIKQVDIYR